MTVLKLWGVYFGLLFLLWTLSYFNNGLLALKAVLELVCSAISDHRLPLFLCNGGIISVFSSVHSVSPVASWAFCPADPPNHNEFQG